MTKGQTLNIQQVEQVCIRLRKYGLSLDDAEALSAVIRQAADTVVPVQVADLVSLMRPRRPKAIPLSQRPAVVLRRQAMRERLSAVWGTSPMSVLIECHEDDVRCLASAVQYRARRDGFTYTLSSLAGERGWCLVQVGY